MTEQMVLKNEEETNALGLKLAAEAKPGMVIGLTGDLGVGKTSLSKAIARGLGVTETITSPTFTIVKEYKSGRMPLYHFDVYRLTDPEELYELGYEEYFYGEGICLVEWADMVHEFLPEDTLHIEMCYGENENERIVRMERREA